MTHNSEDDARQTDDCRVAAVRKLRTRPPGPSGTLVARDDLATLPYRAPLLSSRV